MFDDEFNGTALDTTKWSSSWFGGGVMNNTSTSPANVRVANGVLTLTLSSTSVGALVSTNPTGGANPGFQFTYGYAEARILFPGSGSTCNDWPAFWTDGQSWPQDGEIDIAEGLGTLTSNYHSNAGANNSNTIAGSWCGSWHTYGVDREPGVNTIYWDGTPIRSYASNDGGSPQYLILNVGSGEGADAPGTSVQINASAPGFTRTQGRAANPPLPENRRKTHVGRIFDGWTRPAAGPATRHARELATRHMVEQPADDGAARALERQRDGEFGERRLALLGAWRSLLVVDHPPDRLKQPP